MDGTLAKVGNAARRVREALPAGLRRTFTSAGEHHTLMLAAGLAFFGILSVGPAVGVGFGLVRLVVSADAADALTDLLQDSFPEQLGLGDLIDQMEDRAGRYAGIGFVVLLWPATTLATGWARALDAITGAEGTPGVRGLRARAQALLPGGILVAGLFMLLAAVIFGTALAGGDGVALFVGVLVGAVGLQLCFNLVIYRWLPSVKREWREIWPGAVWATGGVIGATAAFALVLRFGEGLADNYPPALTTAVVLGAWLYAANVALLLGAEYNEVRRARTHG